MARTDGSASFDPDAFLDPTNSGLGFEAAADALLQNEFRRAIVAAFALSDRDSYTYHAMASVTLAQAQSAVDAGASNGLHAWYHRSDQYDMASRPPKADIDAYISIFAPGSSATASLTSFSANAKKDSLRKDIGEYLRAKRNVHSSLPDLKKKKKLGPSPPSNPSFDFWAWSCRNLEWAGPTPASANIKTTHHILPVMMHHFGCVTPSEEALSLLKHVCVGAQRSVVEIGSGNGYWTMMLRRRGLEVVAIDNGQSIYRTTWISDTVREDGVRWLKRNKGAKDRLLLLVYPVTAGNWTADVLRAFQGDYVCVVGTQNTSGYTGFSHHVIDEWMAKEQRDFAKLAQIPLPSFPGKDEALFVFKRDTQDQMV